MIFDRRRFFKYIRRLLPKGYTFSYTCLEWLDLRSIYIYLRHKENNKESAFFEICIKLKEDFDRENYDKQYEISEISGRYIDGEHTPEFQVFNNLKDLIYTALVQHKLRG